MSKIISRIQYVIATVAIEILGKISQARCCPETDVSYLSSANEFPCSLDREEEEPYRTRDSTS